MIRSSLGALLLGLCGCVARPTPTIGSTTEHAAPPSISAPEAEPEPATEVSLTRLRDGVWLHTSTRILEGVGPFPSHGLVVEHPEGPVLVDGAWGAEATRGLLVQIEQQLHRAPRAAIVTDFHDDRAGGTAVLEAAGIEVWTSQGIADQLRQQGSAVPSKVLDAPHFAGPLAGVELEVFHPGAGHSSENLVVWLPRQRVLFGGCLVRPWESRSLGNVADADLHAWGSTIRAVRERYGQAETVVPSHGEPGGRPLLDHTLALVEAAVAVEARETGGTMPPTRMAITVDDLPKHGPLPPGMTRATIHRMLLDAFERHRVPEVHGFVIGQHATSSADHREALRLWVEAGHPLGNHTWSHPDMRAIGVEAYLADIDANEAVLAELTADPSGEGWRVFRYPFLQQGVDQASSDRVRAHLAERGYRIAEVSIDFWDWDYQQAHARCRKARSTVGLEALRETYLRRAIGMLEWHRAAAWMAFGRPMAHVLLLHAGAFTAEMIEELLQAYEERGVVWVTLEEALADPVYRDVPLPPRTRGDVIVEQAITTLGVEHPPWPHHPGALLHALCR